MKKVIFGLLLLVFFYLITPSLTGAQTKVTPTPTSSKTPLDLDQKTEEQEDATLSAPLEDYVLPYPGILPDNPLHFLKALRDRIILFLISDPVKEAEFNLLTSDKRIYAAQLLADKGKGELSVTTLSKSNNYFHNAVSSATSAKKMGKDVDTVLHNMKKSIAKHQQVLSMIEKVVSRDFSNQLQIEMKRLIEFEKSVDNLLLK